MICKSRPTGGRCRECHAAQGSKLSVWKLLTMNIEKSATEETWAQLVNHEQGQARTHTRTTDSTERI
jgi:hypothetical protein